MVHQCFQITLKLNTLREWAALTGQTLEVSLGLTKMDRQDNKTDQSHLVA